MASRPCSLSLTVQNNNFKNAHSNGDKKDVSNTTVTSTEVNLPGEADVTFDKDVSKSKLDEVNVDSVQSKDVSGDESDLDANLTKDCLGVSSGDKTFVLAEDGDALKKL